MILLEDLFMVKCCWCLFVLVRDCWLVLMLLIDWEIVFLFVNVFEVLGSSDLVVINGLL